MLWQVSGAKTRLGFAMKNGDAADLASALTWAAEVVNRGGQLNEVSPARALLKFLAPTDCQGLRVVS